MRDAEIKRREAERKKRHKEIATDRKKSFFELSRSSAKRSSSPKASEKVQSSKLDKEENELDKIHDRSIIPAETGTDTEKIHKLASTQNEIDLNALDYELDPNDNNDDAVVIKKSESMALAFGVEIKTDTKAIANAFRKSDKVNVKHHRGDEQKVASEKRGGVERRTSRGRSRDKSRDRGNRSSRRGGNSRGRNRSRSVDESRHGRRRSVDWRRRSHNRSRRDRSRSRHRHNRSRSNDRQRTSRRSSDRNKVSSSRRNKDRDEPQRERSRTPDLPKVSADDKDRINKEKMIKRAEALVLMKERMRREIDEHNRRQAEKDRTQEPKRPSELDLAHLEVLKKENLVKLKVQEEIKQLTAVKKVMEVVATVQQISRERSHSRSSSPRSKLRHRSRSSSRSSSSDRRRRRGSDKRRRRRHSDSSSSD